MKREIIKKYNFFILTFCEVVLAFIFFASDLKINVVNAFSEDELLFSTNQDVNVWDLAESSFTLETDNYESDGDFETAWQAEFDSIVASNYNSAQNVVEDVGGDTNADTVPSRNYTVVIDPGHGGIDPGSIGYKTKVKESDLNLKMSLKLKEKLESACINVIMTREDEGSLAEGSGRGFKKKDMELRKELIKKIRPNMVISLHQNSYTNHKLRGAQVFYDKTSDISKKIAEYIQEEFLAGLEHSNKTTSPGDYFMLKCTTAPSVIVECGFLSNEEDEILLLQDEYQDKVIDCVYRGIVKFLQINQ